MNPSIMCQRSTTYINRPPGTTEYEMEMRYSSARNNGRSVSLMYYYTMVDCRKRKDPYMPPRTDTHKNYYREQDRTNYSMMAILPTNPSSNGNKRTNLYSRQMSGNPSSAAYLNERHTLVPRARHVPFRFIIRFGTHRPWPCQNYTPPFYAYLPSSRQ